MVGRDLTHRYPVSEPQIGDMLFEVKDWNVYHPLQEAIAKSSIDVNLNIRKGEIVGIAGLNGSRENGACDEYIWQVLWEED